MGVRWRATYDDGRSLYSQEKGAYQRIERSKLRTFAVFPDDVTLAPLLEVLVPKGSRLVFRNRWHGPAANPQEALTVVVALESEDRRAVDLYLLHARPNGTEVVRQRGYGPDVLSAPPVLEPSETVT